jgi:uncharacterized membrane protein HdeD (DUF308 family)
MGNIISYLRWRGDINLNERSFNEVDNVVLSMLAYMELAGIVPELGQAGSISLAEAAERYAENRPEKERKQLFAVDPIVLQEAAATKRFGNARLYNFVDIIDSSEEQTQFAALHMALDDGTVYIAFRGTDDSIVGWRENFSISFQVSPAQQRAVSYLDQTVLNGMRYRIGGHSKGGNLAVYGSMLLKDKFKDQVLKIYNNDGPGLCPEMIELEKYELIRPKIIRIIPQFSIVGNLFERAEPNRIVLSSAGGILQHDAMTWQIEGEALRQCNELLPKCKSYNRILDRWIEDLDMGQRKAFTQNFFDSLEAGGAKTITEAVHGGVHGFESVLFAMGGGDRKAKLAIGGFIRTVANGFRSIDYAELLRTKKMLQGVGLLSLGVFFVALPFYALQMIGTAFALWLVWFSLVRLFGILRLKRSEFPVEKVKMIFYGAILGIQLICMAKNEIIIVSTNLILAFFLGWWSYRQALRTAQLWAEDYRRWKLSMVNTVICCLLGIVAFALAGNTRGELIMAVGSYLAIQGMVRIGRTMVRNAKNRVLNYSA